MANYRRLGSSGLRVSELALGTMQFGWSCDEPTSFAVLDAYAEWGGNLIDTADIYSTWVPGHRGGEAEEIIGRWLAARGNRDEVLIATKVRGPMGPSGSHGRDSRHQREGLSRRWITQSCEDSLRRLGVDHLDLFQAHWVDPHTPIEETLAAFTDLVRRGLVRYLGCSNISAWRLMESLWAADAGGFERFVCVQPEYSLAEPTRADFERELAPACLEYGLGVLPYSPLAAGFLTGKYRRGGTLPDSVRARENQARMTERNWDLVDALVEIADEQAATPAQVAVAWLLTRPFVTAPVLGANDPTQLAGLLPAAALSLTEAQITRLADVSAWTRARTELDGHE